MKPLLAMRGADPDSAHDFRLGLEIASCRNTSEESFARYGVTVAQRNNRQEPQSRLLAITRVSMLLLNEFIERAYDDAP